MHLPYGKLIIKEKKVKKKLLRSGIRSLDLLIMSKMSNYLSYHDTHTVKEEKVLYKVLEEEC